MRGLGDVVVDDGERRDLVVDGAVARERDERGAGVLVADAAGEAEPALAGQHRVEQDEVGEHVGERELGRGGRLRFPRREAGPPEHVRVAAPAGGVGIQHEHPRWLAARRGRLAAHPTRRAAACQETVKDS